MPDSPKLLRLPSHLFRHGYKKTEEFHVDGVKAPHTGLDATGRLACAPMVLPIADVQSVIARQKVMVADALVWVKKIQGEEAEWLEAKSALRYADDYEFPEQLMIVCQWRKKVSSAAQQWCFGLYYKGERIYALDVQPFNLHSNEKAGKGREYFGKDVEGSHEHTWSKEGYGYAEPINMKEDAPEIAWKMFLRRAGILDADFNSPDQGQPDLI